MRAVIFFLVGIFWLGLTGILRWAFDHFMWDWLVILLEEKWNLKEAELIALVSSYVIPAVGAIICLMAIYLLLRYEFATRGTPQFFPFNVARIGAHLRLLWSGPKPNVRPPAAPVVGPFTQTATVPLAGLEKIYKKVILSDGSVEFRLGFLPDTKDYETDSVTICYLYKIIYLRVQISSNFVDNQVKDLVLNAPNTRLNMLQKMSGLVMLATVNPDIGHNAIDRGYVQRVGLASGGEYQLTPKGEVRARAVVCDMIHQA